MFASAATASARAGPDKTALIAYEISRLASSSALIAEISANSCSASSPLRRYRRTTAAKDAGTYLAGPGPQLVFPSFAVSEGVGWPG